MSTPNENEFIIQKKSVVITNAEHLESIIGLIHDEFFVLDEISFYKDEGIIKIPYRRIFHNYPGKLVRNWLISKTYEVDVIRSVLIIYNVKEYTFNDKYNLGTYSFNTISYDNESLIIECCEDIDLIFLVSELKIESQDLKIKGKTRITKGLFWSSNNNNVYE